MFGAGAGMLAVAISELTGQDFALGAGEPELRVPPLPLRIQLVPFALGGERRLDLITKSMNFRSE